MKFNVSNKDRKQIEELLETKQINMAFADMLMSFYDFDLSKMQINNKEDFISLFMEALELDDTDQENIDFINKYIGGNLKKLDDTIFTNNPYFKHVRPQIKKIGDYALTLDHYYKNQAFAYDDITIDDNYSEISNIGYFDHKVSFLALSYKGEIWMNISPNEINTMQPSINEAKGNVLVYGLGLGYYPFMIALKDDVKSITIIEKDKNIIDIFKKNLFQFFKNKEKINIVEADAFDYLESSPKYDYVFVDLWHNPIDGLPIYLKFKECEQKDTKYFYWLENGLKAMYNRCMLTVIEEQLNGEDEEAYTSSDNLIDEIINNLYHQTKNLTIHSYKDIENLLK